MDITNPLRSVLVIGRIGRAHGLRGEFRIEVLTDSPERFSQLEECLLLSADEKHSRPVRVEYARVSIGQVLIKLSGYDKREDAETLRGQYLAVQREQAVKLPPDTWFICDLVGCSVYDELDGYLGILSDIIQNPAQDVYTVHLPGHSDILFPARRSILLNVDIIGRRIDIRLPDGLFEIYRQRST